MKSKYSFSLPREHYHCLDSECGASIPLLSMVPGIRGPVCDQGLGRKLGLAGTCRWVLSSRLALNQVVHLRQRRRLGMEGFQVCFDRFFDQVRRELNADLIIWFGFVRSGCGDWLFIVSGHIWARLQVVSITTPWYPILERKAHTIGEEVA